mmetsp:Transcript_112528/g.194510  ORF Transcript_112528/g.194510 Transcript_112528/m.194510 type:complete len:91 (+) Transcript_112528:2-274(+)
MFLGDCKVLILGKHKGGHFGEPMRISFEEVCCNAGMENIKKYWEALELLLHKIREVALDSKVNQLSVLCDGMGGPLHVHVRDSQPLILPF